MSARPSAFVLGIVAASIVLALASCAGGPTAKDTVREESRMRAYERYKAEHSIDDEDELDSAGIYLLGKDFYVVISLTDSGTDRYPEWACDKLVTSMYGYRVAEQDLVSDEEFFELVLKFQLEEIVEGKYENLARVTVRERDIERFLTTAAAE